MANLKTISQDEGRGSPNAPFLSSERRLCNMRPFQQTGILNSQHEYSKSPKLPDSGLRSQKVLKLRSKHLQEFNKQENSRKKKEAGQRPPTEKEKGGEQEEAPTAKATNVPKLSLEQMKKANRLGKQFHPLTDPDRGRKRFLRNLNLT